MVLSSVSLMRRNIITQVVRLVTAIRNGIVKEMEGNFEEG